MTESTYGKVPYKIHPLPEARRRFGDLLRHAEADALAMMSPHDALSGPEHSIAISAIFGKLKEDLVEAFEEIHNDFSKSSR